MGDPQGSQLTTLIFFVLTHKDITLKCYMTLNVFWKLLLPNQCNRLHDILLECSIKDVQWITVVFCFSPAGYVFTVFVLTLVHPLILFLAVLPLLPASSDPSHHLFSKNTFTVLSSLERSVMEMRNWILNRAADQARKWLPDVLSTIIGKKEDF